MGDFTPPATTPPPPPDEDSLVLPVPAIVCIAIGAYIVLIVLILCIRQCLIQRGKLTDDCCNCCGKERECKCCDCWLAFAESCNCCSNPNLTTCLDQCCPTRKKLTCADVILCQCCETGCCGSEEPLCQCGNCNFNCQCQSPECQDINCCCFQLQPNQTADDDDSIDQQPR